MPRIFCSLFFDLPLCRTQKRTNKEALCIQRGENTPFIPCDFNLGLQPKISKQKWRPPIAYFTLKTHQR